MWLFQLNTLAWRMHYYRLILFQNTCLKSAQLCPFITLAHLQSSFYRQLIVPHRRIILNDNFHKAGVTMAKAGIMLRNASNHGSCVAPLRQQKSQSNKMVSCRPQAVWSWGHVLHTVLHMVLAMSTTIDRSHMIKTGFISLGSFNLMFLNSDVRN